MAVVVPAAWLVGVACLLTCMLACVLACLPACPLARVFALLPACMDTVAARVPHCKTALLCAEVVQSVCMVPAALQWACRLVVQRDASQPPRCMG
mmetsp:Transcript_57510/g.154052  ORF Transcript_57510/g.154052 Transcript_57510/m.154052 type:complete len:95 (+) Transcript_57510:194-478(+)